MAGTPAAFATPTGTVTYQFYTTINGSGAHTDEVVTLNPDGTVPDSALHGPLAAGAFSFVALYSGDSNYLGSTSAVEPLTVGQGTSTTSTVVVDAGHVPVTSPVTLGTSVHDTATIADQISGLPATGTVTYQFYTTIDGTGAHTDQVVTLNPDGTVPDSPRHGPLAAGAYSFIAVYSGDTTIRDPPAPCRAPDGRISETPAIVTEITDVNNVAVPFLRSWSRSGTSASTIPARRSAARFRACRPPVPSRTSFSRRSTVRARTLMKLSRSTLTAPFRSRH